MPESEPKPKLIELVAPGAGQGWKAVLRNGKAVVVHEIPVPPAEATAAAPRMQRLFEHRHPALSPVLGWGLDNNGLWVAVEPNEGTPLGSILTRGPLTPPAAAALGAAVLSGVAALHEAGIAMGGFGATAIRVTTNGDVRLAGHPAAAVRGAPAQSDLRADVRSCGMAVCAAFGVDPAGAPAPANIPPGLVVTIRSMASGAMGPSADRAQGALREMAAALLAPDRQMQAQSELATRAGGRELPPITPFLPAGTVAPAGQGVAPLTAAAAPAAASPAPAPFIAPPRRDETPIRQSVSYEAPDRPLQTYPSIPAPVFPPAEAAAPAPVEPPPKEPASASPSIPLWSDAPSQPPAAGDASPSAPAPVEEEPAEVVQPAVENPPAAASWLITSASAPAEVEPSPPPQVEPSPPPAAERPPAPATWSTNPPAPAATWSTNPPAPAATWSTNPPAPAATWSTNPPAPAPVEPPSPAPPEPIRSPEPPSGGATWTPLEQPVWKPGTVAPAEPLGTGETFQAPVAEPEPVRAPSRPVPFAPAPAPPPTRKPAAPRPRSGDGAPSERPPWLVPAAIAVAVVLLLGTVGVVVLAGRGGNPVAGGSPSPSSRASTSPKGSPSGVPTGLQAVPVYAPSSAAPVSKVQICTTASPCNIPGAKAESATVCDLSSCRVEVALYFTSVQKSAQVSYTLKFFDRCTGTTTDLPGTQTTTSSSGWIVAIPTDHLTVRIPSGVKAGALVAVSQKPAVAASAPLLLGSTSC